MRIHDLSIRTKLLGGFSAVILIALLAFGFIVFQLRTLTQLQQSGMDTVGDAIELQDIRLRVANIYPLIADAIIGGDLGKARNALAEARLLANKDIQTISNHAGTDEDKRLLGEFAANMVRYLDAAEGKLLPALAENADPVKIRELHAAMNAARDESLKPLGILIQLHKHEALHSDTIFDAKADAALIAAVVSAAAVLVCSLAIALFISRLILRPVQKGLDFTTQVAAGDFHARFDLDQKDELGKLALDLNAAFAHVAEQVFWYEGLLDSVPFPIAVVNTKNEWTFVNRSAETLLGAARADLHGTHCSSAGQDACGFFEDGDAEGLHREITARGRDFLMVSAAVTNIQGEITGQVEVAQDITEANELKRMAEAAVREGRLAAAGRLEGIVERLTTASEQLSAQVEQAERGMVRQSQRVAETATAMEQMNNTVLEVARSAGSAADGAESAHARAQEGATVVGEVVNALALVETQAQSLKANMGELGRQTQDIGQILGVISDIADQTNLLALNAAIEAARAGDAGRGFAVVADEVRKLAEKTMQATHQVGQAVAGIQNGARENIGSVDQAVLAIGQANDLAGKSGQALTSIVTLVDTTSDQVRSIATASEEQSAASDEINRSIEDVSRISSETAQAMNQSAQAVQDLAQQAQTLRGIIQDLKV